MKLLIIIIVLLILYMYILGILPYQDKFISKAPTLPIYTEPHKDAWVKLYASSDYQDPILELGSSPIKIVVSEAIRSVDIKGNDVDIWGIKAFSIPNNIYNMSIGDLRSNGVIELIASARGEHVKFNIDKDIQHFYLVSNRPYPVVTEKHGAAV